MHTSRLAASECQSLVEKFTDDIERKDSPRHSAGEGDEDRRGGTNAIREGFEGKTQGLSDQIAAKQKSLEPWNEKINKKQSAVAVATE